MIIAFISCDDLTNFYLLIINILKVVILITKKITSFYNSKNNLNNQKYKFYITQTTPFECKIPIFFLENRN